MLREELRYIPPPPERVEAFLRQAHQIAAMVEVGLDASDHLAAFNAASGRSWRPEALLFMLRSGDLPALAFEAASPLAREEKLSRAELLDLLVLIYDSEPPASAWYIDVFEAALGRPGTADLIFWPPDKWGWRAARRKLSEWQPTPEDILDMIG